MDSDPRQIIANICPELAASPSLDDFLGEAAKFFDRGGFGKLYPTLIAWASCHLFTISGSGGNGSSAIGIGQIASMSEGGLSVTFATGASGGGASSGSAFWDTTKFGKMVLYLIKSRLAMGVNTAGLHCSPHGGLR
jgi:hypothetical protein